MRVFIVCFFLFLENFGTFWNVLEPFGTFWNLLEPFGTFWNVLERFGKWAGEFEIEFEKFETLIIKKNKQ